MVEKREKLWLRCVNHLGENPSYAKIATFLKSSVETADLDLALNSGSGLSHYELEPKTIFPKLDVFKHLYHRFHSTFEYWIRHKDLTNAQVEWIDSHIIQFKQNFRKMSLPNHKFDLMMKLEPQPIMKVIVTQFAEFLDSGGEVKQCAASDCNKIFIPTPQGKEQQYCSLKCRKRSYMRGYRKK